MPPPKIKVPAFLANLPLFKELAPGVDRIATAHAASRRRSETLFHQGDAARLPPRRSTGRSSSRSSRRGRRKGGRDPRARAQVRRSADVHGQAHVVIAQALADSLLLHVSKQAVFDELKHDPDSRAGSIGLSPGCMASSATSRPPRASGTQRVIGYLLHQARNGRRRRRGGVTLPTTKGVIARGSTSRPSTSRASCTTSTERA